MANKLYITESASFGGTSIPDLKNISESSPGSNKFFADGNLYPTFQYYTNIVHTATVLTTDAEFSQSLTSGSTGALIIERAQRASGMGGKQTGANINVRSTYNSNTMLGPLSPVIPHEGESTLNLDFLGMSADGITSPVAISLETAS